MIGRYRALFYLPPSYEGGFFAHSRVEYDTVSRATHVVQQSEMNLKISCQIILSSQVISLKFSNVENFFND